MSASPRPSSSGFATICAFPIIPPCMPLPDRRAGDLPLRVRRSQPGHASARRRGALVAGAVAAGPAERASRRSAARWCCARARRPRIIAESGARGRRRERCSGTRSRRRRIRPIAEQVAAALAADRRRLAKLSRRPAGGASDDPQQGRPGLAGVHAVLAAGAGIGRSAHAVAGAEDAASGSRTSPATRSKAGSSNRRVPTGPAGCARPGRRARRSAQARLKRISRRTAWPAMPPRATGPTATGTSAAVAASALWRDQPAAGLARRPLCRRRAALPSPAISTNS